MRYVHYNWWRKIVKASLCAGKNGWIKTHSKRFVLKLPNIQSSKWCIKWDWKMKIDGIRDCTEDAVFISAIFHWIERAKSPKTRVTSPDNTVIGVSRIFRIFNVLFRWPTAFTDRLIIRDPFNRFDIRYWRENGEKRETCAALIYI